MKLYEKNTRTIREHYDKLKRKYEIIQDMYEKSWISIPIDIVVAQGFDPSLRRPDYRSKTKVF